MTESGKTVEKLAEGVWLKLIARGSMIAATGLFLPLGMWFMHRAVDGVDDALKQLQNTISVVQIMQEQMKNSQTLNTIQFSAVSKELEDHETRIRGIEKPRYPQ